MKKQLIVLLIALLAIAIPASAVTQWNLTDGTYTVLIFNGTPGTLSWTPPTGVTSVEYLVIGGGGGGGGDGNTVGGAGGGAGGYRTATGFGVSGSVPITVGYGGNAGSGASSYTDGGNGSISVFSTIIALGGGGGSGNQGRVGKDGGSGGGGQYGAAGGSAVAGQGYAGGLGSTMYPTARGSGGGGGSGSPGADGTATSGGNGGAGTASSITGTSVTRAGGGGGGTYTGGTAGTGNGGGGNGGTAGGQNAGSAGIANSGGGGGGASTTSNGVAGGAGGSGIVIIKFLTPTEAVPIISFTGIPVNGTSPLTVQFTDTSSNSPTSWSWNFGDGQTNTEQNPSHTYTSAGVYSVSLTATNAGGSNTTAKPNYITVTSPQPATSIVTSGNRYIEQPGEEITFNLTLDNAPRGLSGYNVNISITNPALAEITAISFPSWAEAMNSHGTLPGSQNILMKASDINNNITAGASDITLGTITLRGLFPGTTTISLSSANFDDEDGLDMPLTLTAGNLTVDYPLTDPQIIDIMPTHAYNNGSVNIHLNGTGYVQGMTVKLTKPGKINITSTNVYVESWFRAECMFDLTGKSDGIWNITLTRADGKTATLLNGFTIVRPLVPVQGMTAQPADLNADGTTEDLNGNGQMDYADVNMFYSEFDWIAENEPVTAFDFTGNGTLGFGDIVALFDMIS